MDMMQAYLIRESMYPHNIMAPGWKRSWLNCPVCGMNQYYDYIPYSLQNPVTWSACGHDLKKMMKLKRAPIHLDERFDHMKPRSDR